MICTYRPGAVAWQIVILRGLIVVVVDTTVVDVAAVGAIVEVAELVVVGLGAADVVGPPPPPPLDAVVKFSVVELEIPANVFPATSVMAPLSTKMWYSTPSARFPAGSSVTVEPLNVTRGLDNVYVTNVLDEVLIEIVSPDPSATVSLNVRTMSLPTATEVAPSVGEDELSVGDVVSITIALFAPSEFTAPGDANVKVALLPAASAIAPPFRASELAVA